MRRRLLALTVVALLLLMSFQAFGFGDIVHDPISYANALLMLAQIIRNYEQLKAQYDLQSWESTPLPIEMDPNYRVPGVPWYELQLPSDRFNRLSPWLEAVNRAASAWDGYVQASVPVRDVAGELSEMPAEEYDKLASRYASVEIADATNVHGMEIAGGLRVTAPLTDTSLQAIEDDALSTVPEMNTEKALLMKMLSALVAGLRLSRDDNRMQLSILEQLIVDAKGRRDAQVSELNDQMMRLEHGDKEKARHTETLGEALQDYRWR